MNASMKSGLVTATQTLDDFTYRDDPRFPRERLRRNLARYRLRGAALEAEVDRIVRGPWAADGSPREPETGVYDEYPYGWRKPDMTRLMKRIFHGFQRRRYIMMDEAWRILATPDVQSFIGDQVRRFRYGTT